MSERVIVVAGSGRCGSSLVMQMLAAGGVPTLASYPSFEDGAWDDRWIADPSVLAEAEGLAIKLLCPMLDADRFPTGRRVDWIWCSRDLIQQARSQAKFARTLFGIADYPEAEVRVAMRIERSKILGLIAVEREQRVLEVTFEALIGHPGIEAGRIIAFLGLQATARQLASVVIARDSSCFPGLLEVYLMQREPVG